MSRRWVKGAVAAVAAAVTGVAGFMLGRGVEPVPVQAPTAHVLEREHCELHVAFPDGHSWVWTVPGKGTEPGPLGDTEIVRNLMPGWGCLVGGTEDK